MTFGPPFANYDKAIELYPEYIDAWIRKGITLFNEKEFFDAENCLNRAVSLRPSEFKALYNRGKLRLQTEKHRRGFIRPRQSN